ncbi:MAG: thermonuclease family protein [Geobacteraceae bacterium]|nr:thermonuclease family protein [Geobacteraceae bacterium]
MTKFLVILSAILLFSPQAFAKEAFRVLEGTVVKVTDGDTINIDSGGTKLKIRLYGIDAPETPKTNRKTGWISKPGQPYGNEAWKALDDKVNRQRVRIEVRDVDKYKRLVSVVWLGSRDINREMIAEGWGWAYRKYLDRPHASAYMSAEEQARARRLGLWRDGNPQPPWEFRKSVRMQGG